MRVVGACSAAGTGGGGSGPVPFAPSDLRCPFACAFWNSASFFFVLRRTVGWRRKRCQVEELCDRGQVVYVQEPCTRM